MSYIYNDPRPISDEEWDELAALPVVRENWYLNENEGGEELALLAYGVKFDDDYENFKPVDLYVLTAWLEMGPEGDVNNAVIILVRAPDNGGSLTPLVLPFPPRRHGARSSRPPRP